MSQEGYYRFPTISGERVVFVSEDDLWTVSAVGGEARRLSAGLSEVSWPMLSPGGGVLAFVGKDEGPGEIYTMPPEGGPAKRRTYLGAMLHTVGFDPKGRLLFASNAQQPFRKAVYPLALDLETGRHAPLPFGPAMWVSYGPGEGVALGRKQIDPARWKRYRGGTAGDIWVDPDGSGDFRPLISLEGNLARPMWIGARIYFVSDHQGVGNLYSCLPSGEDLQKHTSHTDYYLRNPVSDGCRIVYHAGGDLYIFDLEQGRAEKLEVRTHAPRTQAARRFAPAETYLESCALHPEKEHVALVARGRVFTVSAWGGPVQPYGAPAGVRYRLAAWTHDGRLLVVSDEDKEEVLELYSAQGERLWRAEELNLGSPTALRASPTKEAVALTNHRGELWLVDLGEQRSARKLDQSAHGPILGFDFSPDGNYLAYAKSGTVHTSAIYLLNLEGGKPFRLAEPVLRDLAPSFDPEGRYLYFLSHRQFDPVYDSLQFDLGFPRGMRPYLVVLRKDLPSPFLPAQQAEQAKDDEEKEPFRIDLEGLSRRVVAFPVADGLYTGIKGTKDAVFFSSRPVEGSLNHNWFSAEPPVKDSLERYQFATRTQETWISGITSFELAGGRLLLRVGNHLRMLDAATKPPEARPNDTPGKKSGWIGLSRVRISLDPPAEWRQIFRETWRQQRDHFWDPGMSQVDWQAVYQRYEPLISRVASRGELSDLLWEMQGELATSHAYEMGGDYRKGPEYPQGFLGADLNFDAEAGLWRIERIVQGDPWDEEKCSPLLAPGVNVHEGQTLLAVAGRALDRATSPMALLVNQAGLELSLTVADQYGAHQRTVTVRTLKSEQAARYRDWVEQNRALIHEKSAGRVGYVHVPDMGPLGYAEFHRGFLSEIDREALLVDVRYNGGGHVSSLLLSKLARRRSAYVQSRWWGVEPYPEDSPPGPMVALTNEYAGSDGDIFSHSFKMMGLGPLIGKRTWGGVIGINPRRTLVDRSIVTQPEFAFYFTDVGYAVENYGTEPDIEVENRPQDYAAGRDRQLEVALKEVLELLEQNPPKKPDLGSRPSRALPGGGEL